MRPTRPSRLLSFSARNIARRPLRSLVGAGLVAAGVTAVLLVWGVIAGQRRALMGQAAETVFGALQVHAKGYAKASDVLPVRPALDDAEAWRNKALENSIESLRGPPRNALMFGNA